MMEEADDGDSFAILGGDKVNWIPGVYVVLDVLRAGCNSQLVWVTLKTKVVHFRSQLPVQTYSR